MSNQQVSLWTDVTKGFEALTKMEQAASKLKGNLAKGKMEAYCLVIAHLETEGAGKGKKDAKAADAFKKLIECKVPKGRARRFVEMAQAFRRHPELEASGDPKDVFQEMETQDIDTESKLMKFLFPPKDKKFYAAVVKHVSKEYEDVIAVDGELKAEEYLNATMAEIKMAIKAKIAENMKQSGNVVATQPKEEPTQQEPPQTPAAQPPKPKPAKKQK